jgi:hypothetical protein
MSLGISHFREESSGVIFCYLLVNFEGSDIFLAKEIAMLRA